jgi:two-component system response regulator AtoC
MASLLLVEDEQLLRWALRGRLVRAGHQVQEAGTLAEAEIRLRETLPQVVILDVHLPDGSGIDFLATQREKLADSAVLIVTADGSVQDAVRAMKLGASDFLSKPVDYEELLRLIEKATLRHREHLEIEVSRRARETQSRTKMIAESPAMQDVLRMATTVAGAGSTTVLIHGQTGAGKEVLARYIHSVSPRSSAALQALNCAALPEHLVESELFGYEKGAFTDAKASRKGIFELADGGTVILDEIGEIPMSLQVKLLRFLEERTFRRLGGGREIPVDVRVIAMTNRSLEQEVARGTFREDLYHRLHVFPIEIPPLHRRREDILPLALNFLKQFAASCGKRIAEIAPELQEKLVAHGWTGNVRELRNVIERAVILEEGSVLTSRFTPLLTPRERQSAVSPLAADDFILPLEEVELLMVQRALSASRGNQSQAARLLQVSRDQLRYRVKRYREMGKLSAELAGDESLH